MAGLMLSILVAKDCTAEVTARASADSHSRLML